MARENREDYVAKFVLTDPSGRAIAFYDSRIHRPEEIPIAVYAIPEKLWYRWVAHTHDSVFRDGKLCRKERRS